MDVEGPPDTLYEGEKYNLCFKFNGRYPFDSPIVTFVGEDIPEHPHVYSNGHICLSILTGLFTLSAVCLQKMNDIHFIIFQRVGVQLYLWSLYVCQ